MRQIKFRAYSTVTGCFDCFDMTEILTSDNSRISKKMLNDAIWIEQFTGLTDKNGIDIYEGDLVCDSGTVGISGNYVIQYIGSAFYITSGSRKYSIQPNFINVIGNIHETPELLPK